MSTNNQLPQWQKMPIKNVYLGMYDGVHGTPPPSQDGPVFLGIKNLTDDGKFDFSDIRHVSEEDFTRWTKRILPKEGDIVFTYEATLHRYAIIPRGFRGCLGRRLALIRPDNNKIVTKYLFYYFFSEEWRNTINKNIFSGATVDRIPIIHFPNFEITVPPLSTQQKIAIIISAYDDLIQNNTRRIKILEEIVQAIYREWFVNYHFPGHEGVRMVESELVQVPEGWEKKQISDIANLFRGRSYGSDNLVEVGGLPFLNLKCLVRDGGFRSSGIKRYQGPYKETQTATEGDIVIAVTDMTQERRIVAHAARIPRMEELLSVLSMDLVKIVPKDGIYSEYLYGILRFSSFADEIKQHANGVNVLHLNPDRIGEYEFYLAPTELRQSYSEKIGSCQEMCDILQLKSAILRRTRDLLLPKLISGELDVSGLDIGIPADL